MPARATVAPGSISPVLESLTVPVMVDPDAASAGEVSSGDIASERQRMMIVFLSIVYSFNSCWY